MASLLFLKANNGFVKKIRGDDAPGSAAFGYYTMPGLWLKVQSKEQRAENVEKNRCVCTAGLAPA
jgi:hypothetical protein